MKSVPKGLIYTILADDKPIVAIETIRRLVGLGLKARSKGLMADPSNRWTPEEDALCRSMAEASTSPEMIAAKLNRSVHAVRARAYAIGLPLKWFKLKVKEK